MSIGEQDAPEQPNLDGAPKNLQEKVQEAKELAQGDMSSIMNNPEVGGLSANFFNIIKEINYACQEKNKAEILPEDASPGQIASYIDKHLMPDVKDPMGKC